MKVSTITPRMKPIKYKDVTVGIITLDSNGYVSIASYKPSGMENFLFAAIKTWSSTSPVGGIFLECTGGFVGGLANQTITGLQIRYYYTD